MPQAYVARVEKDTGWLIVGGQEVPFKHWSLAPEQGGRFPAPGDYVQYREQRDPTRGGYLAEVRKITPPAPPSDGKQRNVYVTPAVQPGIARLEGDERIPLEVALQQEADAHQKHEPIQRVTRPTGPLHSPVSTDWDLPTVTPITPTPKGQTT